MTGNGVFQRVYLGCRNGPRFLRVQSIRPFVFMCHIHFHFLFHFGSHKFSFQVASTPVFSPNPPWCVLPAPYCLLCVFKKKKNTLPAVLPCDSSVPALCFWFDPVCFLSIPYLALFASFSDLLWLNKTFTLVLHFSLSLFPSGRVPVCISKGTQCVYLNEKCRRKECTI